MQPKSISQIQTRKEKEKRKMVISDESSTADPSPSIKSMTTLTLPANISKVAKACQKAQALSESKSLMWNEKVSS